MYVIQEFTVPVNEEFTEHLYDGALSIEVYGHSTEESKRHVGRSLADRWSEVTRKLELSVEIQELNSSGEYEPVEVQVKPDIYCGGIYQLRQVRSQYATLISLHPPRWVVLWPIKCSTVFQGFSRRVMVKAKPLNSSGSLPLTVDAITGVSMGGICVRSCTHKGLDSYQEDGLSLLRSRWNEALEKRRQYLDDKMQILAAKKGTDMIKVVKPPASNIARAG